MKPLSLAVRVAIIAIALAAPITSARVGWWLGMRNACPPPPAAAR